MLVRLLEVPDVSSGLPEEDPLLQGALELHADYFADGVYDPDDLRTYQEEFARFTTYVVTANLPDSPLAVACVDFPRGSRQAELESIVVASSCRGRGVGSLLLKAIEGQAREKGYTAMHLQVENTDAVRRFYLRQGYTSIGTVIFQKSLT